MGIKDELKPVPTSAAYTALHCLSEDHEHIRANKLRFFLFLVAFLLSSASISLRPAPSLLCPVYFFLLFTLGFALFE